MGLPLFNGFINEPSGQAEFPRYFKPNDGTTISDAGNESLEDSGGVPKRYCHAQVSVQVSRVE
jgi:hypothetical protein